MIEPAPEPPWITAVREAVAQASLRPLRLSTQPLPPPDSPIVVAVVCNERLRLADFLRHYREAGIRRFCFVDNASTDDTAAFLAAQPDVDLHLADGVYGGPAKQGWIIAALAAYGPDRWVIYADADEHLVFDGIETRGFDALAREMDARGIRRVRGIMLDMYAEGPLLRSDYPPDGRLLDAYPFLDASGYLEREAEWALEILGGPRPRVFAGVDPSFGPNLGKVPMFRLAADEMAAHAHFPWPIAPNFTAPRLLGLLHFKFPPDFAERIREGLAQTGRFRSSAEYRVYEAVCARDPEISMLGPPSRRYDGSASLVQAGLIAPVGWDGPAPAPAPDGAVSRLATGPVLGGERLLLERALRDSRGCCVFGIGPAVLMALRQGIRRVVAVERDKALCDALRRRPVARDALRKGHLTILNGEGPEVLRRVWAFWRKARIFPTVIAHGPYRVATALGALRCAAAMRAPTERMEIVFAGLGPARPWYEPVSRHTREIGRAGIYVRLRPATEPDPAALEADWKAHLDDPR
jgi:hypothetical protein